MNAYSFDDLFKIEIPIIPEKINDKITINNKIEPVEFVDINNIFNDDKVKNDIGFLQLPNKDYLVAMKTKLPNITIKMVEWWFWWHAQDDKRYQVWYPGAHKKISFRKKDKLYFNNKYLNFSENIQYPIEKIGNKEVELSIHFVHPKKFGIDDDHINKQNSLIICANVGIVKGLIQHTKMMHCFYENFDGLELISRFWLGNGLPRVLKKIVGNKNQAIEMAKHCWTEYTRLGQILGIIYRNESDITNGST